MPKSIASSGLILQQRSPNDVEGFSAAAGVHGQRTRGAQQCCSTRGSSAGAVRAVSSLSATSPLQSCLRASRHRASPCLWGTSPA